MLHITASTKLLKEELRLADSIITNILNVLSNPKSRDNLTYYVGKFVVDMPEFKVLCKDSISATALLRKVCTGEISPDTAYEIFDEAHTEIRALLDMYDSSTSF